ncbi:MAG: ABC transporter permease subunit [Paenibacillaceae bacterium]|nr:ABC transporter permease subunit [Paenibacillaceae bacterium]
MMAKKIAAGISLLLLLASGAYLLLHTAGSGRPFERTEPLGQFRIAKAVEAEGAKIIASTVDNRLVLLVNGAVSKQVQIDDSIGDIAVSADRTKIYVGTASRKVFLYNVDLAPVGGFEVNGRVASLDSAGPGRLIVAYGIGQYSEKYWISLYDEQGTMEFRTQIGFDINAIASGAQGILFATDDGDVGLLSPAGEEVWRRSLQSPVARAGAAGEQFVAGDLEGNVYRLNAAGQVVWTSRVSNYKIGTVASVSAEGRVLAGDESGKMYMLGADGQLQHKTKLAANLVPGPLRLTEESFTLFTENGEQLDCSIDALFASNRQAAMLRTILIADAVLLLALIAALVAAIPRWRAAGARLWRRLLQSRKAYVLLLPSLSLMLLFKYVPALMAIGYSFTNFSLKEPLAFIGLDNFVKIGSDRLFWTGMKNMGLIVAATVVKDLTMPLLTAELIFWLRSSRLKYWLRTSFVLPTIVPGIVVILLWKMIYNPDAGLINHALESIGLGAWKHAWLAEESLAIWSIMFAGFPFISIFAFLVYYGGLIGISKDIYDAAAIDGMDVGKRFRFIDLPMIRPQIRLIVFLAVIGSVQSFANIYIYTRGGPGTATYVPGLQMYDKLSSGDFGYASSLGVVLAVIFLIGVYLNQKFAKAEGV